MEILICVFFAGLIIFHLLERVAPIKTHYRSGPKRRGYWADLTATLVDGPVLSALIKLAAFWLVMRAPDVYGWMGEWPWALQFTAFFLFNDFGRYWLHRWHHEIGWLWRIHRVHHTVVEMDALSVFRVHVLEGLIKYGLMVLPFRFIGIDDSVIIVYSSVDILKGFWHHANLRTSIGRLNYIFNSAELHWWHHSTEARGQLANYGSVLSIWDRLFGTFYFAKGEWPEKIGVEGMEGFPDTYIGQFATFVSRDEDLARPATSAALENDPSAQQTRSRPIPADSAEATESDAQAPDAAPAAT